MRDAQTAIRYMLVPLLAFLPACRIGPEYERPDVEIPETWRVDVEDANSIADLAWWELFDDEGLRSLITAALQENKDLRIAITRVEEARGVYRATRAGMLPTADGIAEGKKVQPSEEVSPGSSSTNEFRMDAAFSWELDLWGKLRRATDAAAAEVLASEESRRAVILTLIGDVATAYFEWQDLERRRRVAEDTVVSRTESLRLARLRFKEGLTSELEVKQAESELADAQVVVPDLDSELFAKENEISVLLGRSPQSIPSGRQFDESTVPLSIPAGLPAHLLERRPDIREAEQQLIAASARIGIAQADFLPSPSLFGTIGLKSLKASSLFNSAASTSELGIGILAPLYRGGRLEGNLQVAKAQYEQTRLQYEQTIQQALREVNDAIVRHRNAGKRRQAQEDLVRATGEYAGLAFGMYVNGEVGYLEFLDAQRRHFQAELALSETIRLQLVSLVQAYKALGGGWEPGESELSFEGEPVAGD